MLACKTESPSESTADHSSSDKKSDSTTIASDTQTKSSSSSIMDGETYQILLPQKKGEAIKIQPKVGYKVNKDFPHRLTLLDPKTEILGEHSESLLSFSLTEGSCKERCKGSADFSICNDQMCKLYRDIHVSWSAQ